MEENGWIHEGMFRQGVNGIVGAYIERICIEISKLNSLELCYFSDVSGDYSEFQITMLELMLGVSDNIVARERQRLTG